MPRFSAAVTTAAVACSIATAAHADETPRIELYTMGPGDFIVEKYGHAALCVRYPTEPRKDNCYNYGVTNFEEPLSLGWGFLRGRSVFWVDPIRPRVMLYHYRAKDRTVWKQILPLSRQAALKIADKLETDLLPENKHYDYHHFHDNCTTRVRDIINDAVDGKLKRGTDRRPGPTFRDFGRDGFAEFTGLLLVADLLGGRPTDIPLTEWQTMFLPRYLRKAVTEKLGAEPQVVYRRQGPAFPTEAPSKRWIFLLVGLLLAVPLVVSRLTNRLKRTALVVAALPLFALGLFVWGLAIVSTLPEIRYNEALLLFFPADIALPFLSPRKLVRYARLRLAIVTLALLLVAVGLFTQPLWGMAMTPLFPLLVVSDIVPWLRAKLRSQKNDHD